MSTGSTADNQAAADDTDDLSGIGATVRRLLAEGLGPAMGLGGDWRKRSAVKRVARLGPEELNRRIEVIYETCYEKLVNFAASILRNRRDAEEVVQDAFLRVLEADPDLKKPEALAGYVSRAVRNRASDRGRQMTRDRGAREPSDPIDLQTRLASRDKPLADQVCDDVMLALGVNLLSPRQRQCIVLRFGHDLSIERTAAQLGISEGNVKRLCHDACSRLAGVFEAA